MKRLPAAITFVMIASTSIVSSLAAVPETASLTPVVLEEPHYGCPPRFRSPQKLFALSAFGYHFLPSCDQVSKFKFGISLKAFGEETQGFPGLVPAHDVVFVLRVEVQRGNPGGIVCWGRLLGWRLPWSIGCPLSSCSGTVPGWYYPPRYIALPGRQIVPTPWRCPG